MLKTDVNPRVLSLLEIENEKLKIKDRQRA